MQDNISSLRVNKFSFNEIPVLLLILSFTQECERKKKLMLLTE